MNQTTWDEDLPWLSLAFNTAVHASTKSTPDKLFLGRELSVPYWSGGIYPLLVQMVLGNTISRFGRRPIGI